MLYPAMMACYNPRSAFRITGNYNGLITDAGKRIKGTIGILVWLLGITAQRDTRFNVVACQTKYRIADLNVIGYASNTRKHKARAGTCKLPAKALRVNDAALYCKFNQLVLIYS